MRHPHYYHRRSRGIGPVIGLGVLAALGAGAFLYHRHMQMNQSTPVDADAVAHKSKSKSHDGPLHEVRPDETYTFPTEDMKEEEAERIQAE